MVMEKRDNFFEPFEIQCRPFESKQMQPSLNIEPGIRLVISKTDGKRKIVKAIAMYTIHYFSNMQPERKTIGLHIIITQSNRILCFWRLPFYLDCKNHQRRKGDCLRKKRIKYLRHKRVESETLTFTRTQRVPDRTRINSITWKSTDQRFWTR